MKLIMQKNLLFTKEHLKEIEDLGVSIEYYNNEEIEGDIYVGYPFGPFNELDDIKGLKFIQALSAGFDGVNFDKVKEKGIVYANASGISSVPIAEYVLLKMLDHSKNAQKYRDYQKESYWIKKPILERGIGELYKRKALVLGTGHIGKEIAKRLQAFEVEVSGVNSTGYKVENFDNNLPLKGINDKLSEFDYVIGCLPLNEATYGLYNKDFLLSMDADAVFINVGRGPQIIEEDLLEVLEFHLDHVYLDVVPTEPLSSDSKLWTNKKISLTPHISANSDYIDRRMTDLVKANIENYKSNQKLINRVV